MTESLKDLSGLLVRLIAAWENEVVEFKRGGDGFDTDRIGRYFSALANEANLRRARMQAGSYLAWTTSPATWSVVTTGSKLSDLPASSSR